MLIVWIGQKSILFFLSLCLIPSYLILHLVNDCFNGFVCDWIKLLTDIFDTNFIKHLSN